MPWLNLDYETKLKVIDKINLLSSQEESWRISNGLKAAAQELESLCDSEKYGNNRKILSDFIDYGKTPEDVVASEIIKNSKNSRYFVSALFSLIGAVGGFLVLKNFSHSQMIVGSMIAALTFGIFGYTIGKKRK